MSSLEDRLNQGNKRVTTFSDQTTINKTNFNSLQNRLDSNSNFTSEEKTTAVQEITPVFKSLVNKEKLPEGWDFIPQVPTGDNTYQRVVIKKDKPNIQYTINLETGDVEQKDISNRDDMGDKRTSLFKYKDTGAMTNVLYKQGVDILADEEFILKTVPDYLQPLVRVVAKGADFVVVKPLAIGVTAGAETITDAGNAIIRAAKDNIADDSVLDKLFGYYKMMDPNKGGRRLAGDIGQLLEVSEAGFAVRPVGTVSKAFMGGEKGKVVYESIQDYKNAIKKQKELDAFEKTGKKLNEKEMELFLSGKNLNVERARIATNEYEKARQNLASKVASLNNDIADKLIDDFEQTTGTVISSVVQGKKVVDYEKVRGVGEKKLNKKYYNEEDEINIENDERYSDLYFLKGEDGDLTSPILNPDKFDKLVALVSDLKKANPDEFDKKVADTIDPLEGTLEGLGVKKKKKAKPKTLIDELFDLTVKKDLLASDELTELLAKYGVSFEDYILMVVGSGSKAGKILNKLSQIKRVRSFQELAEINAKKKAASENVFFKGLQRIENIRRGGLVGTIATAARNLESALIRTPTEGLVNLFETSILRFAQGFDKEDFLNLKPTARAVGTFFNPIDWKDSFRHLKYIYSDRANAEDYTNFIFENSEFDKQVSRFYDMVSEIRKSQGAGSGGKMDAILSEIEGVVDVVNKPNRWQDYLIRRGVFLAELERLTRRDMGIDLIETINNGKIRDLINQAPSIQGRTKKGRFSKRKVTPEAPKFIELVNEATEKALDITYGSAPKIQTFREIANFITRKGLTTIIPFPRFMFKSMELMGEYSMGLPIALAKQIVRKGSKYDATMAARNLVGLTMIGAAGLYRNQEDAPAEYNKMRLPDGSLLDVMPIFPLGQMLYIAEADKRFRNGTFDNWFDAREFIKIFTGTNFRPGMTGEFLLRDLGQLAGSGSIKTEEALGKGLGRIVGNYAVSFLQPFSMAIDLERSLGGRTTKFKDANSDPDLTFLGSLVKEFKRPFKQRGFISPSQEAALPDKVLAIQQGGLERMYPVARLLGGFNITSGDTETTNFIKSLGLSDYDFSGKTKVGSVDNAINETINDFIPNLAAKYLLRSKKLKALGYSESYVQKDVKARLKSDVTKIKSKITKASISKSDDPAYITALFQFRSMNKDFQSAGIEKFKVRYGRFPDVTKAEDLNRLYLLASSHNSKLKF